MKPAFEFTPQQQTSCLKCKTPAKAKSKSTLQHQFKLSLSFFLSLALSCFLALHLFISNNSAWITQQQTLPCKLAEFHFKSNNSQSVFLCPSGADVVNDSFVVFVVVVALVFQPAPPICACVRTTTYPSSYHNQLTHQWNSKVDVKQSICDYLNDYSNSASLTSFNDNAQTHYHKAQTRLIWLYLIRTLTHMHTCSNDNDEQ